VPGDPALFAAGDGAALPIKQGGLAAQVADAAAAQIARRAGVDIEPRPARMVLRGLLRTSHGPLYLRAELRDPEGTSIAAREPLWWPPSKVASRWLAGHLARREALTRDERHLTPVR
jgi:sulfide:quinone oxidoreductase